MTQETLTQSRGFVSGGIRRRLQTHTHFLGGANGCCSWSDKKDSALTLVKEEPTPENRGFPFAPTDANIIIRSSDKVNFRVHKSLLAMSSPFFRDLLSLPQPPDGELVDGLPVDPIV
ncbi:hypothetical protein EDB84DRAFT_495727 [Lactarius hengduanensis]|nr:hypothetical protein EDB84DRAFT_495727 [Lactarius hengduanensis]